MQKVNNLKSIEFNLRDGKAYILSSSLTTMGLWMSTVPCTKVEWHSLSSAEKFNTLNQALERSKVNVPMPENTKHHAQAVLENLGFKSWKKFYEGGYHCTIDLDIEKKEFKITPMIYLRDNTSLYGIKKGIEVLSSESTPEVVVSTLEKILARIPELTEDYYANEDVSEE